MLRCRNPLRYYFVSVKLTPRRDTHEAVLYPPSDPGPVRSPSPGDGVDGSKDVLGSPGSGSGLDSSRGKPSDWVVYSSSSAGYGSPTDSTSTLDLYNESKEVGTEESRTFPLVVPAGFVRCECRSDLRGPRV